MQGQIVVFLAAGYETTSTTLAYFSYYMALYPEIQAKLQEEIDEYFPDIIVSTPFYFFFLISEPFDSSGIQ